MFNDHKQKFTKMTAIVISIATITSAQAFSLSSMFGSNEASSTQSGDAIADIINQDRKKCAEGAEGTVGKAIYDSVNVHVKIASAAPNVESLFSIDNPCFSGLTKLNDLSFAIPTMASVISDVSSALEKYAAQQVCTFAKEQVSMVTTPINNLINEINTTFSGNAINGMIGAGLSNIDPQLGAQYTPSPPNLSVNVNTNGLAMSQLTFTNTQAQPTAPQLSGGSNTTTNQPTAQTFQNNTGGTLTNPTQSSPTQNNPTKQGGGFFNGWFN